MRAIYSSKKLMVGLITILLGVSILMTGISYAWFTSSGISKANILTVKDGDIVGEIKAEIGAEELRITYPGEVIPDLIGRAYSTGGLPVLMKLDLSATIRMLDGSPGDSNLVTVDFQPGGTIGGSTNSGFIPIYSTIAYPMGTWINGSSHYRWGEYNGSIYVAISGTDMLHFAYTVRTNGQAMGNEYQNATIHVNLKWESTQLLADGAIYDVFGGISSNDINWFSPIINAGDLGFVPANPFSPFSIGLDSEEPELTALLADIIAGLPQCSYRTSLVELLEDLYRFPQ